MPGAFTRTVLPARPRCFVLALAVLVAWVFSERHASAQGRDGLLNGTVIGAAVGVGTGVAFAHAVRDSDLGAGQYAHGALIFGAIGAGIGLGVDALLNQASPGPGWPRRRKLIVPVVGRNAAGVVVKWRW